MAMQYEATLLLKGDDQTAEAFRSASDSARRFADQQTRATRGMREDVDSVGRAFRGLGRVMAIGGLAGTLTQAVTQAANFGDKLNRIGINARASEETMRRVGATLRQEASRLNLDIDRVVEGFDAWRVASGQSVEAALHSFPAISEAAIASATDFPCDVRTVHLPQLGDDLFRLMTLLQHCGPPPSEHILQGGPIQWGRIT
jgi:hypothetical protein